MKTTISKIMLITILTLIFSGFSQVTAIDEAETFDIIIEEAVETEEIETEETANLLDDAEEDADEEAEEEEAEEEALPSDTMDLLPTPTPNDPPEPTPTSIIQNDEARPSTTVAPPAQKMFLLNTDATPPGLSLEGGEFKIYHEFLFNRELQFLDRRNESVGLLTQSANVLFSRQGACDENGIFAFDALPDGLYYFIQTKTAPGYAIDDERKHYFEVEYGIIYKIEECGSKYQIDMLRQESFPTCQLYM